MPYVEPQVFVQGQRNTAVNTTYQQPSIVCIIGRMDKYPTRTTSRVLANGTTVTIEADNVLPDTIKLTQLDGTELIKDTDYTQSVTPEGDTFSITVIKTGMQTQSILISYQYLPENFFECSNWYTKASVQAFYGPAFDDEHYVDCPITAAANYCFDNGATTICCIPVIDSEEYVARDYPTQTLDMALEKLKLRDDIAIIVPVNMVPGDLTVVKEHIQWCNTNNHALERRGIFGVDGTQTDYSIDDLIAIEQGLDDVNILFTPNTIAPVYVTDSRTTVNLPGWLYAAAIAGVAISLPVYHSLIRQQLRGFFGVQGYLVEEKNILAQSGGCVIELANGVVRIRDSVTTYQQQLLDWSYSGVYNYIVRSMRLLFDPYIGLPSNDVVISEMAALADNWLARQVDDGMIYSYRDLEVARRNGDPSIIDVTFAYAYISPIRYIYVNFSVDMEY